MGDLRSRYLVPRKALSRGRYFDEDRRSRTVVPIRFVRACRKGHVGDIDWRAFVHRLREVVAQVGFTRFEAASPDEHGELELGVERAALARGDSLALTG
jgi:hypothetical protein